METGARGDEERTRQSVGGAIGTTNEGPIHRVAGRRRLPDGRYFLLGIEPTHRREGLDAHGRARAKLPIRSKADVQVILQMDS